MSKFKIVNLFDKLFITVCVFLIMFAWINFYIRSLWITLCLSVIFSISLVYVLFFILNKKNEKKLCKSHQIDSVNSSFFNFRMLNRQEKLNFLKDLYANNYDIELKNGKLEYLKDGKKHLLILASPISRLDNENFLDLIEQHHNCKADCIDIICGDSLVDTNKNILKNKQIFIVDKFKLFSMCEQNNLFPKNENLNVSASKVNFKQILQSFFVPSKSKPYFMCGLILIFSSIILPFHVYYLIFGSILLLFSLACKMLQYFK